MPVRSGPITGDFGVNLCPAGQCVIQFFQNDDTAAARNHEPIAVCVKGPRRLGRGVIVFGTHRAHRIKEARQGPVQFFAATGKDNVLLAHLDLFDPVADAVQ